MAFAYIRIRFLHLRTDILLHYLLVRVVSEHFLFGEIASLRQVLEVRWLRAQFGHQYHRAAHKMAAKFDPGIRVQEHVICKVILFNLIMLDVATLGEAGLQHDRLVLVLGAYLVSRAR